MKDIIKKSLRIFLGIVLILIGIIGGFIPILQGWMFILAGCAVIGIRPSFIKKKYIELKERDSNGK